MLVVYEEPDILYYPNFLPYRSNALFESILKETNWQQREMKFYGKVVKQPRMTAFYGDEGLVYNYSGIQNQSILWKFNPSLLNILNRLPVPKEFNACLLNLYRDGQDSVSWHSDDEYELENEIASVSLGATRTFQMRRKDDHKKKIEIELEHGSLLIMRGDTQKNWEHQVPKTKKDVGQRINLTFRKIKK